MERAEGTEHELSGKGRRDPGREGVAAREGCETGLGLESDGVALCLVKKLDRDPDTLTTCSQCLTKHRATARATVPVAILYAGRAENQLSHDDLPLPLDLLQYN